MKSSSTKQLIGFLVVILLFALGVYGYMFYDLKSRNEHISALLNDIDNATTHDDRLESAKKIVEDVGPDMDKLEGRVVGKEADLVKFIEYIESLGRQNGVGVTIDSVQKGVAEAIVPGYGSLDFKIKTTGSFSANYVFLSLLETIPYDITIRSVSLGQAAEGVANATSTGRTLPWTGNFEFSVVASQ